MMKFTRYVKKEISYYINLGYNFLFGKRFR